MLKKKFSGFLLVESILSLFLLSLVLIPWFNQIKAVEDMRLSNFFELKEVFLQIYYSNNFQPREFYYKDKRYALNMDLSENGLSILIINQYQDDKFLDSLVGVVK